MKKLIIVCVVSILVGCTTSAKVHAVRGVSGVEVDCSGLGGSWEQCYERASRECEGGGYKVVTKSSDARDEEGDYPFGWSPAGYLTRTMLIICR